MEPDKETVKRNIKKLSKRKKKMMAVLGEIGN